MAKSKEIRAGGAFVELYTKDGKLNLGLDKIARRLQSWGATLIGLGTRVAVAGVAMLGPLIAASAAFASAGTDLAKMSTRTGIAASTLSELEYALRQSGSSLSEFEGAVKDGQKNIQEARAGNMDLANSFAQIGLSAQQLATLSPEDQILRIGQALSRVADPGRRSALAMKLLGDSGRALLPFFDRGAAGIEQLRQRARALGLALSEEDISEAFALGRAYDEIAMAARAVVNQIGRALSPTFRQVAGAISGALAGAAQWIRQNPALVTGVAMLAAGLAAAGIVLVIVGAAIFGVGAAISALLAIVGFFLTPLGLLIAGVGVLAYVFRERLGNALSSLTGWFKEVSASFNAVLALVSAGDLEGAFALIALELQAAWTNVTNFLSDVWVSWVDFFQDQWDTAVNATTAVWQTFMTRYKTQIAIAEGVWEGFCTEMKRQFLSAIEAIVQALEVMQGAYQGATAGMSALFGSGSSVPAFAGGLLGGSASGVIGAANEAGAFAGAAGNNFNQNQNDSRDRRRRERENRDVGIAFQRMADEELLRMERERRRNDANWTTALMPGALGRANQAGRSASDTAGLIQGSNQGTFSGAAVRGLAFGRIDEQQLAAMNRVAGNTTGLVDTIRQTSIYG